MRVLCARGYRYDASTLPTVIGPVARAFYVRSANLSAQQRQERKFLFGSFRDGFRSLRPYSWSIPDGDGASIPEIPVTTLPLLRIPIHVSYLLYIAEHSVPLALRYFDTALRLCDIRRVRPSLLLHPLDFLGGDDVPSLSFFPAMSMPSNEKSAFVMRVLDRLQRRYEVVTLAEHLDRITVFEAPRTFHSPKRDDR